MKSTPVTSVDRFVSIDDRTVVCLSRHLTDDTYNLPTPLGAVWGIANDDTPDSFREIGRLQDVLQTIAPQPMVVAAALASPKKFAQMVAAAHDLGLVFYVGSRALWAVADHIANAKRFCAINVTGQSLTFHTLLTLDLSGKRREHAGVYSVSYSLAEFNILSRIFVES